MAEKMEGKRRVCVMDCPDYGQAAQVLSQAVELLGGIGRFVAPGETILLKANLLRPAPPESAVCTHPAVVEAVAAMVKAAGGRAVIADSPGGALHKEGVLRNLYEKTGMADAARRTGAQVSCDPSTRLVSLPQGKLLRQAEVIAPAAEADGVFDLCKMKTHVLMGMTGAVKNVFGILPGLSKVGFHGSHPDRDRFAGVLLDLAGWLNPRLCVMDGVLAMEGEGPGASGTPRQVGLLLVAENPLALDVAAGWLMGLPEVDNPLLQAARRRGLEPNRIEQVELMGTAAQTGPIPHYRFPANVRSDLMGFLGPLAGPAARLSKGLLSRTPRVRERVCVGCGICKNACPGKAISLSAPGGKAKIQPSRCIRCYCCHELCPHKAIELRHGLLR